MKMGIGRIHEREKGAISIYIEKSLGSKITLPRNERTKIIWDEENERIIIEKWE
jgi:hypothetical protein